MDGYLKASVNSVSVMAGTKSTRLPSKSPKPRKLEVRCSADSRWDGSTDIETVKMLHADPWPGMSVRAGLDGSRRGFHQVILSDEQCEWCVWLASTFELRRAHAKE